MNNPTPDKGSAQRQDRFDAIDVSRRAGAHRVTGRPRRFWVYFVAGLVSIVVITGLGIAFLHFSNVATDTGWVSELPEDGEPAVPAVKPELDPSATVAVLNGTSTTGFAAVVDGVITSNGFGQILFSGEAASHDVQISAVFYSVPEDEAAARGLAQELGGVGSYLTEDYAEFGARLIVLLGSDYAGPGAEQLVPADSAEPEAAE